MSKKRISGSSGSGKKILDNWNLFTFKLNTDKSNQSFYSYDVAFASQGGFLNYTLSFNEDEITEIVKVNLDLKNFPKTLGQNNDNSLFELASKVHSIQIKE